MYPTILIGSDHESRDLDGSCDHWSDLQDKQPIKIWIRYSAINNDLAQWIGTRIQKDGVNKYTQSSIYIYENFLQMRELYRLKVN